MAAAQRKVNRPCNNPDCRVSSGIHGYDDGTTDGKSYVRGHYYRAYTFGSGELDEYGFWEKPCAICARANEEKHPEHGPCWPFAEGIEVENV